MDDDELTAAITSSLDLAKDFLSHLYPEGVFVSEEGFSIGDFRGTKAKGGDGRGSTYIHIPECTGADKTTGEKCNGPLSILRRKNEYSPEEARNELQKWLKTQGAETGSEEDPKKKAEETAYPWMQLVEGTKDQAWSQLTKFRGYPKKLISRIRDKQLLAHDGEYFCFPITNKNGVVVGIDRLVAHPLFGNGKKQRWTPIPVGLNRHANWYSIGCEIAKAKRIIATESRWDSIALLHQFTDQELQELALIGAAGTSQCVLPKCTAAVLFAALQNDEASERWAFELFKKSVGQTVRCLRPPTGSKDFNQALRAGKLIKFDLDKAPTFTADAGSGSFKEDSRPLYYALGGPIEAPAALEKGARILAESGVAYNVGGVLNILEPEKDPINLLSDELNFNVTFQRFARTLKWDKVQFVPSPLSAEAANLLKQGWNRSGACFPYVDKLLAKPMLLQNGAGLFMPTPGYHPKCKGGAVYVVREGRPVPEVTFTEAKAWILELTEEFVFATEGDQARMIAMMLGPGFHAAGYIVWEYPLGFFNADFPGAGKTTLAYTITLFNDEEPNLVTGQEKEQRGVGSLNNSTSAALLKTGRFVLLDNQGEGLLTSSLWASALTGDRRVQVRAAYSGEIEVDCRNKFFMITSNGCQLSEELFERSLTVNLKTKPGRWKRNLAEWKQWMIEKQPYSLGCRNSIIREWHRQGCPKVDDPRHRFTEFSSVMGGVTEITLQQPKMLDGVEEMQAVMTDPTVGWGHNVAKWMVREPGYSKQKWYTAKDLEHLCRERSLHPPGVTGKEDSVEYNRAIGRTISKLAKISDPVRTTGFLLFTQHGVVPIRNAQGNTIKTKEAWQIRFE